MHALKYPAVLFSDLPVGQQCDVIHKDTCTQSITDAVACLQKLCRVEQIENESHELLNEFSMFTYLNLILVFSTASKAGRSTLEAGPNLSHSDNLQFAS